MAQSNGTMDHPKGPFSSNPGPGNLACNDPRPELTGAENPQAQVTEQHVNGNIPEGQEEEPGGMSDCAVASPIAQGTLY